MMRIKVYGFDWCEDTARTREHLDSLGVPYDYINLADDKSAEAWVTQQNNGKRKTPTVDFGGKILIEPTNSDVDAALK